MIASTGVIADQAKSSDAKEDISKLLRKTAKMIGNLDISKSGTLHFSKIKKRITRHLKRAIVASDSEVQKKYFRVIIKNFRENKFADLHTPGFIAGTKADLILNYDNKSQNISAIALKTCVEEDLSTGKLFDMIRAEIRRGMLNRNVRFFPESNVVKVSEALYPDNFKERSIILDSSGGDLYPGIIIVKNVVEKYFVKKIQPISQQIFQKEISSDIVAGSLIRNIFLHHIAHYAIPFQTEVKGEKGGFKGSGLKELFFHAEEIRADLYYLSIVVHLYEKELLDDGVKNKVVYTFLSQKVDKMRDSKDGEKYSPSSVLLNALYSRGGVKPDKDGEKLVVDMELLIRNIKNLESRLNDFVMKGKYGECKAFFQKNMEVPENIKSIIKNIKSSNTD